jgi:hypothetical protein
MVPCHPHHLLLTRITCLPPASPATHLLLTRITYSPPTHLLLTCYLYVCERGHMCVIEVAGGYL